MHRPMAAPDPPLDDAVEVRGLLVLLHPDADGGPLQLAIQCGICDYTAYLERIDTCWMLLLQDAEGSARKALRDESRDSAIVSALLCVLDAASLLQREE